MVTILEQKLTLDAFRVKEYFGSISEAQIAMIDDASNYIQRRLTYLMPNKWERVWKDTHIKLKKNDMEIIYANLQLSWQNMHPNGTQEEWAAYWKKIKPDIEGKAWHMFSDEENGIRFEIMPYNAEFISSDASSLRWWKLTSVCRDDNGTVLDIGDIITAEVKGKKAECAVTDTWLDSRLSVLILDNGTSCDSIRSTTTHLIQKKGRPSYEQQ